MEGGGVAVNLAPPPRFPSFRRSAGHAVCDGNPWCVRHSLTYFRPADLKTFQIEFVVTDVVGLSGAVVKADDPFGPASPRHARVPPLFIRVDADAVEKLDDLQTLLPAQLAQHRIAAVVPQGLDRPIELLQYLTPDDPPGALAESK